MKLAVMGTGGVGGLFGARLAECGHDVTFIARGKHLQAIKENGLLVESELLGDALIKPAKAVSNPEEIGPVDFVLFTVKLWDTVDAAHLIKPLISKNTAVVSLQNGVIKDKILSDELGTEHIVGGVSYVAATIKGPGVISQKGTVQKLAFNEYKRAKHDNDSLSKRIETLRDACIESKIIVETPADIERTLWEKFVVLVAMSTVTASARQTIGPVRANPQTREQLMAIMSEVVLVARAKEINLPEDIVSQKMAYLDGLAPDVTASMEHDLRHGNRLELPWLAGSVLQMAAEAGVETPVCAQLTSQLQPFVNGSV
ncbi:MAG: 2-dehydropantoate 2-reductase [Candidatus Obscuribacterales bacterium]|nr:2-dehydropantoate 2-reductase [Candidatus Obscuribacterales bacterium]